MLQRLQRALSQVKADNTSKDLLSDVRRIAYYLHQAKEITKICYDSIMNSKQIEYKMDTTFMSSEKKSDFQFTQTLKEVIDMFP